jgi:ethanolamine permease
MDHRYQVNSFDIWALGITIVIGGQYFGWNLGLEYAGFNSMIAITLIFIVGYSCLCCCTSEMSSVIPFAGGAYGLARVTLGNFLGYLIGCCETLEYIIYVATSAVSLGEMITEANPAASAFQPLIWFVFDFTGVSYLRWPSVLEI